MGCLTLPNATMTDAAHGASSGSPRHQDSPSQSAPCGHAQITSNGRENDGLRNIIVRSADRQTWNNGIQRQRFINKTMTLAKGR